MLEQERVLSKVLEVFPDDLKAKAGEKAYEAFVGLRRKIMGARVDRVMLTGDREISYLEIDGGKDETVLFLHGFADSKDTFYDAAQYLVADYNIICPDLPGFGKSFKRRSDTYCLENYGAWLSEFIEAINLVGFHVAGNSLGGAVALQVALMIPHKIKTLTLIDPAGIFLDEPYSLHHELFDGHVIFDVQTRDEFEYFLQRVFSKQPFIPHPIKDFLFKEFSRHGVWHRKVLADLIKGLDSDEDPRLYDMALNDRLPEVQVPTFILWGDEDSFFPKETAYFMQQKIPHAELHLLADTGHCPQIESPKRFALVFRKFLHRQCLQLDRVERQKSHRLGTNVSRGYDPSDRQGATRNPHKQKRSPGRSTKKVETAPSESRRPAPSLTRAKAKASRKTSKKKASRVQRKPRQTS
ncbi:alpha/beta fold hydrolase [Pseudobacteriovorax antillogorgiicola]|uniref:Pimeloyl-ACP methyl ester carboxylesterase n=1 Tax=Pseudobacteriovorax antillogorgiicola TaxID=1513793 RepID=A0A1Y6BCS4_9BACT|nr:alpha/beta hydrolase [Pseudobacteriovorax antillogorgiicola]TCS58523.1 pimeloyl-ACP methyl ester carboxylesterase [Pseudobacteriovorax antillogorgiicola]SME97994.1 Pimeloyl-ACP methyl ester carboxylesterase [Pseudobacteriovorax antillogorgiicola]